MTNHSDEYVSADVEFKTRTKDAVLIAFDGDEAWIPRSVLSYRSDKEVEKLKRGENFTLQLKEWFAEKINLEYVT